MNKDLSAFLNANNFQNVGANRFYGNYKGFQFSGNAMSQQPAVSVAAYLDENTVEVVKSWVKQNARNYSISTNAVDGNGIGVTFAGFGYAKKMIAFITDVADYLATVTNTDSCPFCGEPLEGNVDKGEPILIDCGGNRFRIHEKCFESSAEKAAQADAAAAAAPGNYLRGAAGMLLGSLVGGGVFIALYFIGYIAWIAPLVAAFLGSFLYAKFGGKNDKIKIIILWAVTAVIMIAAIFISFAIDLNVEAQEAGLEIDFFEFFKYAMENSKEFHDAVLQDIIISAIFLVGSDAYMTYVILKTQKPQKTLIKRLS